ncbi:MAG: c-type cytochrome [Woeseiaceae bacterium]|nr:c-type cytochrome [Woeseiaceae bacterium]
MRHILLSIAIALALTACAHRSDDATTDHTAAINGEAAYLEHCAGCHETGMMGAPRESEPVDWQARSNLWQAVLMEHAKTGYFDMPARGGKMDLPDEVVEAAAEYMLEKTFPDRPED